MEEIRLWRISSSEDDRAIAAVPATSQTETEEMLEDILVTAPDLLLPGLRLVGRQVDTTGGPLDLLGVDEDGQMIVFELKRATLTRDAVAQVLDYASYLEELTPLALAELVSKGSGKYGIEKIDDFEAWYEDQFGGKSIETIGKPRMILVGLGVDDRARRITEFLASRDVDISLITFHGFKEAGNTYLARQVEVAQKPTIQSARVSKQTNMQALERRMREAGVTRFFSEVASVLRSELSNSYEWPNQGGYGYYFQSTTETGSPTNRAYVTVSIPQAPAGSLLLTLYERAIEVADEEWARVVPLWEKRVTKRKGYYEVRILSAEDWQDVKPDLKELCSAIVRGRKAAREREMIDEHRNLTDVEASVDDKP